MKRAAALLVVCLVVTVATASASAAASAEEGPELLSVEITDLGGCRGCAGSLERSLGRLEAVEEASLHDTDPVLVLRLLPKTPIDLDEVRRAVRDKGYTAGPIEVLWDGEIGSDGFVRQGVERRWRLLWSGGLEPAQGRVRLRARVGESADGPRLEVLQLWSTSG